MTTITWEDFEKVDIRVGKIIEAEEFSEARNPSYKFSIDFGPEIGIKKSSGQFVKAYSNEDELVGKLVLGVVNFQPKQIGPFLSESLTLGIRNEDGFWIFVIPDKNVPLGGRLG